MISSFIIGFCSASALWLVVGIIITKRDISKLRTMQHQLDRIEAIQIARST